MLLLTVTTQYQQLQWDRRFVYVNTITCTNVLCDVGPHGGIAAYDANKYRAILLLIVTTRYQQLQLDRRFVFANTITCTNVLCDVGTYGGIEACLLVGTLWQLRCLKFGR